VTLHPAAAQDRSNHRTYDKGIAYHHPALPHHHGTMMGGNRSTLSGGLGRCVRSFGRSTPTSGAELARDGPTARRAGAHLDGELSQCYSCMLLYCPRSTSCLAKSLWFRCCRKSSVAIGASAASLWRWTLSTADPQTARAHAESPDQLHHQRIFKFAVASSLIDFIVWRKIIAIADCWAL
jgi:hypothetical protein